MLLNLGHSMQLKVLAEGVEDEKTRALLQSLGCDEAQGYHYAKPMPAHEFEDYLRNLHANTAE